VIVCAETGWTDSANPVTSDVMTNPRRDHCLRGENPSNPISGPSMQLLPPIFNTDGKRIFLSAGWPSKG